MSMKRLIDNELMETISTYMNDDIRESVHFDLAPCTNKDFIKLNGMENRL